MKWFTLSVVLFGYVSCATLERFDSPPAGSSVAPTWQSDRILEDFQFLEARSRISQAAFPADVVSYVADRMEGIQPAAGPTRIVNLAAPLHIHHQVSLTAAVDLEAELDYAPFPISDSGKAAVTSLVALPADPNIGNWNKSAAIVTNHEVNVETLRLLSAGGVRAALIVGPLSHNPPAQVTVRGLVALQITDSAALQIAGLSGDEWSTWIAAGTQLDLAEPLHIDVDMQSESWMPGVLGFVPGSDPAFSSQVVIVCAGLAGAFGGRRSVSTGSGLAPALVMELARQYARWSAFELFPKTNRAVCNLACNDLRIRGTEGIPCKSDLAGGRNT